MKKEINTLFALLRSAVFGEKLCDNDREEAAEKAPLLYEMSKFHDMAHLLDYAYKINGISANNEETAFKFIKQQAMAVMRYENFKFALEKISMLFEEEKIPFVPLKGAVIRDLYPEPWMRTSCDIDILVHEEDISRAEKALVEKLGFTSKGERGYHDISLYSDMDVHLELHFNIKENMQNIDTLLERVWDYALPKKQGGYEYVLTNEFFMFQHVAHMSYHVIHGGMGIKGFMDLHLLESELDVDREIFYNMLEECGLLAFYETSLRLSNAWFSGKEHDEETLVYQRYLLGGGVYGTKKNQIAVNLGKKSTFSYAWGRIFMPYKQLCTTYPKLEGKPFLLPFYQAKRWCRALKKHRLSVAYDEIKANKSVNYDSTQELSKLFESMKLNKIK